MQKAYTRAAPVVQKEESGIAPRFFVRALVELDDWVSGAWTDRDSRKTLSKGNSKALTSLRQKLRKYTKEFDAEISKFRENPDLPDDDDEKKGNSSKIITATDCRIYLTLRKNSLTLGRNLTGFTVCIFPQL